MSYKFVQQVSQQGYTDASTLQATFGSPNTLGNLIVVSIWIFTNTASIGTLVDTAGNTYHLAGSFAPGTNEGINCYIYYAYNIFASVGNKITLSPSNFNTLGAFMGCCEYSGIRSTSDPLRVADSAQDSSGLC